jgi:hypothetical protein
MTNDAIPAHRAVSPARIAVVTAGLIGTGAVAGAFAGALGATLWVAVTGGLREAFDPAIWWLAGMVGAPFGAVLLPLAGFTALRRVPLGQLVLTVTAATALGSALGATLNPESWLVGAIAGFVSATGWLWARSRRGGAAAVDGTA